MKKVYIVIWEISPYGDKEEDWEILWIFSTKELAEKRKQKETYYKDINIKSYILNYFNA